MSDDEILAALVDRSALALTMYGEARGDARDGSSVEERIAVGCVIRNRWKRYGSFGAKEQTYRAVCLAPKQFSCWLEEGGGSNHGHLLDVAHRLITGMPQESSTDPLLKECLFLADGIISGALLDATGGATHYFAPKAMEPAGSMPRWARGKPTRAIGTQLFLQA